MAVFRDNSTQPAHIRTVSSGGLEEERKSKEMIAVFRDNRTQPAHIRTVSLGGSEQSTDGAQTSVSLGGQSE